MPLSDSSGTCTRAVRLWPSPAGLPSSCPAGIPEVSRFSCLKFLGVRGVFDYAGPAGRLAISFPSHVAFRVMESVGTLIASFRSSMSLPTYTSVYASPDTSRCPTQNSRPSGSLLLSREAFPTSASDRFIPAHPSPLRTQEAKRWRLRLPPRGALPDERSGHDRTQSAAGKNTEYLPSPS